MSAGRAVTRLGWIAAGVSVALVPATALIARQAGPAPATTPAPAATPTPAPAGVPTDPAAIRAKGRELFDTWGCGSCHSLADANATGHVGPAFDGDPNLSVDFVKNRVTNGQGPMPSFGGQMTDAEIATIAAYVMQNAAKP